MDTLEQALAEAGRLMQAGRLDDARRVFEVLLGHHPRTAVALRGLAAIRRAQGDLDGARRAIVETIRLEAEPPAFYLLGQILEDQGALPAAATAYRLAADLQPGFRDAAEREATCRKRGARGRPPEGLPPAELDAHRRLARPTVSACLIVKDEAKQLGRCLGSVRPWVDEIVVVDTGSTDDSVRIAEAAGARVSRFAWIDDFSAARNAALAEARGDWILTIDADEELVVHDAEGWRRALRDRQPAGRALGVANLDDRGAETNILLAVRLFQRRDDVRYAGRLHEDVGPSLAALGWPVLPLGAARLRHYGYQTAAVVEHGKAERNVRLAAIDYREHPDSPRHRLSYFISLNGARRLDEARIVLAAIHANGDPAGLLRTSLPGFVQLVLAEAQLWQALGDGGAAERALDRGLAGLPGFVQFLLRRGQERARRGDLAGARADWTACLGGATWGLPVPPAETDALPRHLLSLLPPG